MHSGLMPVDLRCTEIRILVWRDRPGAGWKRLLVRPLLTLVEGLTR
jgi:hypothetical protein